MFGMLEAIYGFFTRMIGTRTDTADPNGSLHSKSTDIKSSLGNTSDSANTSGTVHAKLKAIPLSPIKSIQYIEPSNIPTTNMNYTITSVNMSKTIVIPSGFHAPGIWAKLTTATNVLFSNTTGSNYTAPSCGWWVIEFN